MWCACLPDRLGTGSPTLSVRGLRPLGVPALPGVGTPHSQVSSYLFICMGVLISTSRRGALGLRSSATVPCRARQGIQEVPGGVYRAPPVYTGACAHAAGSTPQAAAPLPLLLCVSPRTHFPRRKPQILIPQPLARPVSVPHNCLGFSLLPLRPPGPGSSLPWGPHSASSLVSCSSPHPFTPHPAARTFLVSFFVTLRGMWDQTHAPRSGSMESTTGPPGKS